MTQSTLLTCTQKARRLQLLMQEQDRQSSAMLLHLSVSYEPAQLYVNPGPMTKASSTHTADMVIRSSFDLTPKG